MSCTVLKSTNVVDQSINVFPPRNAVSKLRIVRNYDSDTPDQFTFKSASNTNFTVYGGTFLSTGTDFKTHTGGAEIVTLMIDEDKEYAWLTWDTPTSLQGVGIGSGACPDYSAGLPNDNIYDITGIFADSPDFNQAVGACDVSNTFIFNDVFRGNKKFNRSLSGWNTQNAIKMDSLFWDCYSFNQPLNHLKTSHVVSMVGFLKEALKFNQPINKLDLSSCIYLNNMFWGTKAFNQSINEINMSSARDLSGMFQFSVYNLPITNPTLKNVQNLSSFLHGNEVFNSPIVLDMSSVTDMRYMFYEAKAFNQNIADWNIKNVMFFENMLNGATSFNQDLSAWCGKFNINADISRIFNGSGVSTENYDNFLNALWLDVGTTRVEQWRQRSTPRVLFYNDKKYSQASAEARSRLVGAGWTIIDGGLA
ncbi:BspA family leucine-rich repeat surface protein [Acinetobacter baumannii]